MTGATAVKPPKRKARKQRPANPQGPTRAEKRAAILRGARRGFFSTLDWTAVLQGRNPRHLH